MELEDVHLVILSLTALVILVSDHQGLGYLRGKIEVLAEKTVVRSHRLVWGGLIGMMVSGALMVAPAWRYWLQEPAFYVKMGFVLVLVVNAWFIGKLSHYATHEPFRALDPETQKTLLVSGALSGIGWVGAAIIGFFFL